MLRVRAMSKRNIRESHEGGAAANGAAPTGELTPTEVRPWGSFTVLADTATFKMKTITVLPGKRLSYQRHKFRQEHWYVVSGVAEVTLDGIRIALHPGQAIDIPRGALHRLANSSDAPLMIAEIQTGTYFGEDDIERVEDDFGRV